MKEILKTAGLFFAACTLFSCTINKSAETPRTITVSGKGTVSAEPDQAAIVVSVVTQEWIAKQASDENAVTMAKVRDAVIAAGITPDDIATTDYNINRQDTWVNGRNWPGKYQVRNSLNITIKNTNLASTVIDAAVAAGANELSSLSFSVADTSSFVRQARTLAVQQAQDAASLLAGASGCKIGQVISITENNNSGARLMTKTFNAESVMAAGNASTPVSAGKIEVSSNVTITYALQ
ncbi:MAG: SIMPL domain-containing protein [Treponema sp.]|nr:SIMPL domain-containing protein [Treponema sp.]